MLGMLFLFITIRVLRSNGMKLEILFNGDHADAPLFSSRRSNRTLEALPSRALHELRAREKDEEEARGARS